MMLSSITRLLAVTDTTLPVNATFPVTVKSWKDTLAEVPKCWPIDAVSDPPADVRIWKFALPLW